MGQAGELERIRTLESYGILQTKAETAYDDIVQLAATIADTPAAFISFVDTEKLWLKSARGIEKSSIAREKSYCRYVVRAAEPVLIEDTEVDPRFTVRRDGTIVECEPENPSCESEPQPPDLLRPLRTERPIRFYLGVPLLSPEGYALGTLCVLDYKPRKGTAALVSSLQKLAGQVIAQLELRRANALVENERETFEMLFEVAPVALVLLSGNRIVRCNHGFSGLVSDRDTADLVDECIENYLGSIPDQVGVVLDTKITDESRRTFPVAVYRTHLDLQRDSYDLLAITDISDRIANERMLQEKRLQAENASRIKDTFLSLVSHDLKSPLSGILSMLDLLATSGDQFSDADRTEVIRDLRGSAALLVEMINQLLNIHRLESGKLRVDRVHVPVRSIAHDVVLSLQKQSRDKEVRVEITNPANQKVFVDEALFREALFNLLSNAIKFSPRGGVVEIGGDGADVWVTDRGAGIPETDIPGLFRQEVKTSRPGTMGEAGTGLGLPLVRDIMRAHDGDVRIRYTGPEGTCILLQTKKESVLQ